MAKNLSNIIRAGAGSSPLPITYGGTGLSAPGTSGNILVSNGSGWLSSSFPTASDTVKGGVKVGTGLTIDGTGFSKRGGGRYQARHAAEDWQFPRRGLGQGAL